MRALIGWAREDAKGLSMSIKLTDTQLVMLSAAAQRDDRCLVPAPKLKGAAAQKIAGKLMAARPCEGDQGDGGGTGLAAR